MNTAKNQTSEQVNREPQGIVHNITSASSPIPLTYYHPCAALRLGRCLCQDPGGKDNQRARA